MRPPWIPEDVYDAVLVDRLVLGGLELHGVEALVPRRTSTFDGDEAGLLGMDVLSQFVVDVDGPVSTLRIWPQRGFSGGVGFAELPFWGSSLGCVVVRGAVDEIGEIPFILDTGAPVNVVVGGPSMHVKHPRHDGGGAPRREDGTSPDYESEVEGLRLGPFPLPRMPALGHDHVPNLPFLDDDSALVGLGVMRHFRMVFDASHEIVHVAPGASYVVLTRLGIEIDQRNGLPTITRILGSEHRWQQPLREGDIVRVDGRNVATREEALSAIATARRRVTLVVERRTNRLSRTLLLP